MKPSIHAITSFSIGVGFGFLTKSVYAGLLCFASGVLVDVDHVMEYVVHFGWRDFSISKVYDACKNMLFKKLYLVFHSAELLLLIWTFAVYAKNIYLLAVALGYSSHLILDFIGNPLHPFSYFIVKRFMRKFETARLWKTGFSPRAEKD